MTAARHPTTDPGLLAGRACTACSSPPGGLTLPQAAQRLDAAPRAVARRGADRASRRSTSTPRPTASSPRSTRDGDGRRRCRAREVLDIVATRGKMQNPVTGLGRHAHRHRRGGRPRVPLGLRGRRPRRHARLALPDARSPSPTASRAGTAAPSRCPAAGHAILFGRIIAATLPADLDPHLALMVMDVCGAPALVARVVGEYAAPRRRADRGRPRRGRQVRLALARRRPDAGAGRTIGVVPSSASAPCSRRAAWPTRSCSPTPASPLGLAAAVESAGGPADVTVVCVDVPGCEQPAILATAQGGTIIFFSMATNFAAAALGAEGLAADVRMLVGNGYVPGHADTALRARAGASPRCGRSSRATGRRDGRI